MLSLLIRLLLSAVALSTATAASAFVVTSTDRVLLHFDFSTQMPAPPYQNINFQIYTALSDDINAGESFTIQAFDATDSALSNALNIEFLSDTGGGMESGFGGPAGNFFGTLSEPTGYLQLTNIVGSFDIVSAKVIAANLNFFPPGTPWINATIQVVAVPEPPTLALILIACALALRAQSTTFRRRSAA